MDHDRTHLTFEKKSCTNFDNVLEKSEICIYNRLVKFYKSLKQLCGIPTLLEFVISDTTYLASSIALEHFLFRSISKMTSLNGIFLMLFVLYFNCIVSRIRNIMISLRISSFYLCREVPQNNFKQKNFIFSIFNHINDRVKNGSAFSSQLSDSK